MTVRLIARLDIKGPNVIKTVRTEGLRVVGNPKELAERYYQEGIDELIYMDIVASLYGRNLDFEQLRATSEKLFIPLTVGGGIRSAHDIQEALRAGADKVALNTYALKRPEFVAEAAERFGSQCIVLSVEAKKTSGGGWEPLTDGGREHTHMDALEWVRRGISLGAGEVLLTSIDQDGTRAGYDIELIRKVVAFSTVPVVVHGGAGSAADVVEAAQTGVSGVSASSIYHYGLTSIAEVKQALAQAQIPTRPL